jgi:outer membrane lipoprotein SlyB
MKKLLMSGLLLGAAQAALSQNPYPAPAGAALCERCGTVEHVRQEKRKGEGGAAGIVGGAVIGGLLGNQIGKGNGRALATAGGAVAGGYAGNEIQKNANSRTVWVTQVRMRDGSVRRFEQPTHPNWTLGTVVRVKNNRLVRQG